MEVLAEEGMSGAISLVCSGLNTLYNLITGRGKGKQEAMVLLARIQILWSAIAAIKNPTSGTQGALDKVT